MLVVIGASVAAEERMYRNDEGQIRVNPVPVPDALVNPWPKQWEEDFWWRAAHAIDHYDTGGKQGGYGTTWFESEKQAYPRAMFDFLAGNRENAIEYLQSEDASADDWHRHTLGIDYYACFTLKNQIRKYFFFGPYLEEEYRQRMYDAAKIWTERDPLGRPHPLFGRGKGGEGWGPDVKGSWVDVRGTDNLRAMRETAVYLMAEETGNEEVRRLYKDRLAAYVVMLYHIGMSEWDSENYLTHGMAAWLNLYDFAEDREVRALAKAALDWLATAGALKYRRGGMTGPCMRDYGGGNVVFGSGASHMLALYFGDTRIDDPHPHYDDVHAITSAYRPPQAVVELARKKLPKPVELINTKPIYAPWTHDDGFDRPRFWETLYFGKTYQLGSLVSEGGEPLNNMCRVMSLAADNSRRGVDYLVLQTNPPGEHALKRRGDQIGQYRNLMLWLSRNGAAERFWLQLPKSAQIAQFGSVSFIALEETYVAFWPIELGDWQRWPGEERLAETYPEERFLVAECRGDVLSGFALEVGERGQFRDFEHFQEAVARNSRVELDRLVTDGTVTLTGSGGSTLSVTYNRENDLPVVVRDGSEYDWSACYDVYRAVNVPADRAPISEGWQEGTLRVRAGGHEFSCTVTPEGRVQFGPSSQQAVR